MMPGTPPPWSIGIIELVEKLKAIYGAQRVRGKILSHRDLEHFCQSLGLLSPHYDRVFKVCAQGQMSQFSQSDCGFLVEFHAMHSRVRVSAGVEPAWSCVRVFLSPLKGLVHHYQTYPHLAVWAALFRRFAAAFS